MLGQAASRLTTLENKRIAFLDCGKRGGDVILAGIADKLGASHTFEPQNLKKTSAHSCASKKILDQIKSEADAAVYGVVN